jgi:hypothetical protein
MAAFARQGDAPVLTEDQPDGAGGARETEVLRQQRGVACKVVENGLGSGSALEVARRIVTDVQDAVNHLLVEERWRMFASSREAVKDSLILR